MKCQAQNILGVSCDLPAGHDGAHYDDLAGIQWAAGTQQQREAARAG